MAHELWMIARNPETGKYHVVDSNKFDNDSRYTGTAYDTYPQAEKAMNAKP